MNSLSSVLGVLGAIVGLAAIGGGVYGVFRSANQDAALKAVRADRDDYLSRLNFIEPRLKAAEDQNQILRELVNPTAQLTRIEGNTAKTIEALDRQSEDLAQIHRRLPMPKDQS